MLNCVVKLRGLPYDCNAMSIVEFFNNSVGEEDIHFLADFPGSDKPHAGEAFIVCEESKQEEILKKNKEYMGERYIDVLSSSMEDKEKFTERLISAHSTEDEVKVVRDGYRRNGPVDTRAGGPKEYYLKNSSSSSDPILVTSGNLCKVRGLPFETSVKEVEDKFAEWGINTDRIVFDYFESGARMGQKSGKCFLVFENSEQRDKCLQDASQQETLIYIGNRYLELIAATENDVSIVERMDEHYSSSSYRGYQVEESTTAGSYKKVSGQFHEESEGVIKLRGLPYRATKDDISDWLDKNGLGKLGTNDIQIVYGADTRASGDALVRFGSRQEAKEAAETLHKKDLDGRYVEVFMDGVSSDGRRDFRKGETVMAARGKGKKGMMFGYSGKGGGNLYDSEGGKFGYDRFGSYKGSSKGGSSYDKGGYSSKSDGYRKGSTSGGGFYSWLKLRGLPFEATERDVLDFFNHRYGLTSTRDVILERPSGGKSTGVCFVKLNLESSGERIEEVVQKFNRATMGPRYIEVYASDSDEVARNMRGKY